MPFDKVDTQVDFPALERATLAFWDRIDAFRQLREKIAGKPKWSFLDGPITANNPMGVHHAWGRTYKDAYNRYFAMTGHDLRFQNGFDCQGLWVEVEVEKELKLGSKRDIENLVLGDRFASIDKFVNECKARVDRFARVQTDQSIRLGYWMDWDRTDADWAKSPDDRKSYFTMSEDNNYTIWAFLKKCYTNGWVYKAYDAMPWCGRCGTGISQQEMNEGYKIVAHRSIFVRFPLHPLGDALRSEDSASRLNESLLVWTTTPWTLTSNVGAAVNPELTYLKVKQGGQIYYVGKTAFKTARLEEQFKAKEWVEGVPKLKTLEQLFKEKSKEGFEIVGEVKGAELVGRTYDGPFDEFPAQNAPFGYPDDIARVVEQQKWAPAISGKQAHRVVAWDEVGETEGTGIVHIAPGCGKEDFALGKQVGLPPVAPLDESGIYHSGFGPLSGKAASSQEVVEFVANSLKEKGILFATEMYPHKYPHCWRCKQELLYRLVDEWFINMGPKPVMVCKEADGKEEEQWQPGFRTEIAKTVANVTFLPEDINGKARELDWLRNMGDWMISKKRYWGLALPIWVDETTGEFEVIGSREELKERAVEGWPEFEGHSPHRPWVDRIKICSKKTGNLMTRIGDVGNPWLDAGIVPYSTMGYNRDRESWKQWFPADFITECFPGQFRNWFYAILAMSALMESRAPFKVLLGHGLVRDQNGEEMHKSKGNAIEFNGAANDGYELFVERNPKLKLEDQAKKELPAGFQSIREDDAVIDGKPQKVVKGKYAPIGADVIRWMYCRAHPSSNINIGPGPSDEIRAKFILKLWNTYAFFCNYARLDGFDPTAQELQLNDLTGIDHWILSDLQSLIKIARTSFENFDVQRFCIETEKYVDEKLSNWYLRRNRRRFWKSEVGTDKTAAYQTLYIVLTTLTKLIAPVIPFLAETMWQNLRTESDAKSIHLSDYPVPVQAFEREDLSDWMKEVLNLVSLGNAARNVAKIKVRQPVAEIRYQWSVFSRNFQKVNARGHFEDQIKDELNVKHISTHDSVKHGQMLHAQVRLNLKTAGPKLGPDIKEVQAYLAGLTPLESDLMVGALDFGPYPMPIKSKNESIHLLKGDFIIEYTAPEGWVGIADRGVQVMLDTRITPELAQEGMARDVIRQVQELRKKADLQMEDRIVLCLVTDSLELKSAIETHRNYIAAETLTAEWASTVQDSMKQFEVKLDGRPLTIALRKV